jgi:hypothetical protein
MLNVAYKLNLGSIGRQSGKTSDLLAVETHAALGIPVNTCRVVLAGSAAISLKPEDAVSIELGYDQTLTKVFTGKVATVERGIERLTVNAAGAFSALTAARYNCLYEKQNAGDIAGDLLGRLQIDKDTVATGEKFAGFNVSDRQPVWDVLLELARRCGFDFYADVEDKAIFKPYAARKTHAVEYGRHLLDFMQDSLAPALDGVEVYGESPVGQGQGEDASSWLTKKEVKGSAGKSTGNILRLADATARTQDLVRTIAGNILQAHQTRQRGRLRLLGNPEVQLGDAVTVSKLPDSAQDGSYKVTGVCHRLNARVGFVTDIDWEQA